MKKILFVIPGFHIGGTTISLYNLLSTIDKERYLVDIFALDSSGPYKDKINNCRILDDNLFFSSELTNKTLFRRLVFFCMKIIRKVIKTITGNNKLFYRYGSKLFKENNYDAVVSFQEGGLTELVSYIPAKKHIAWIHSDYKRYLSLANNPDELRYYKRYQNIVCVSEYSKNITQDCLHEIKDRIITLHNIIDYKNIRESANLKAEIDYRFDTSTFTIVSVGRIDPVKQFEKVPAIAAKLKNKGISFNWYLIGGTIDEIHKTEILENIKKEKVENEFIWLGEKTNIYPYIANADLLVSTSLSESFPLVINEAKVLGIPVIANNFKSAYESVENGKTGYVVPLEEMPYKIYDIINNKTEYSLIKNYLKTYIYDNESILNEIYHLFEY